MDLVTSEEKGDDVLGCQIVPCFYVGVDVFSGWEEGEAVDSIADVGGEFLYGNRRWSLRCVRGSCKRLGC